MSLANQTQTLMKHDTNYRIVLACLLKIVVDENWHSSIETNVRYPTGQFQFDDVKSQIALIVPIFYPNLNINLIAEAVEDTHDYSAILNRVFQKWNHAEHDFASDDVSAKLISNIAKGDPKDLLGQNSTVVDLESFVVYCSAMSSARSPKDS